MDYRHHSIFTAVETLNHKNRTGTCLNIIQFINRVRMLKSCWISLWRRNKTFNLAWYLSTFLGSLWSNPAYMSDNQTLIIISLVNAMITRHNRPCFDYGDRGNEKKLDESMRTIYILICIKINCNYLWVT